MVQCFVQREPCLIQMQTNLDPALWLEDWEGAILSMFVMCVALCNYTAHREVVAGIPNGNVLSKRLAKSRYSQFSLQSAPQWGISLRMCLLTMR